MKTKVLSGLICTAMTISQWSMTPTIANSDTINDPSSFVTTGEEVILDDNTTNLLGKVNSTTESAVSVDNSNTNLMVKEKKTTAAAADIIVDCQYNGEDGENVDGIAIYKTIKGAIESISTSNTEEKIIFVKDGIYKEKLSIGAPYITLIGENAENTILTYDDASGTIKREEDGGDGKSTYGTSGSASVSLKSSANNFKAANITIENSFDEDLNSSMPNKQAVALKNESDQSIFINCKILGNQDTLYANKNKQYYYNCYIEGDVDFIFGAGQSVFEDCEIKSVDRSGITPKGYVTAPSTYEGEYGFLMLNCDLTSDENMNGGVYLGRPWHPSSAITSVKSSVVYKNCKLGSHIAEDGWTTMSNSGTLAYPADNYMYEYKNSGSGTNTTNINRLQLTEDQANNYSKANILSGWDFNNNANVLLKYIGESETVPDKDSDNSDGTTDNTTTSAAVTWSSTEFGASTSSSRNVVLLDSEKNTVTLTAGSKDGSTTGGKITGSQDGITYYYTMIDPSKNFDISADVKVNYFEKSTPDNQCGFGIMARDTIGVDGDTSTTYSNMALVGGYRGAIESVFRNGVVDSTGLGAKMEGEHKFSDRPVNDGTATYKLRLRKTNTGYLASVDDGNEVTYYRPKQLEVQDPEHIYLGFFAARVASITVSNINLTTSDVATDQAGESEPETVVTPSINVTSSTSTGESIYNLDLVANISGIVKVKQNQEQIYEGAIDADNTLKIPSNLVKGDNKFDISYTPATEIATIDKTYTVSYKTYGDESGNVYVSQNGTENGDGTENNPIDIYTAIKYTSDGQTIKVKGGTYNLTAPITIQKGNNGVIDKLKTITSYDGERVIFDFGKTSAGLTIWGNYWKIYGIDVCNTADKQHGITISGNNNVLENIKTYKNGDTGLQISGSTSDTIENWPNNNLILNCESYDNIDAAMNNADGFAAKISVGYGNVFRGCISHNNCDDGWDLYTKSENGKIGPILIEDCIAYENGTLTDGTSTSGDGNGFKLGGEGISVANTLKNSLSFNNNDNGITSNSNPAIVVKNCISADNKKTNIDLHYYTNANLQFSLSGNISFRTISGVADDSIDTVISDDNYFYDGSQTSNKSGTLLTNEYFKSVEIPSKIESDSQGNIIWPDYMNPVNGEFTHSTGSTTDDGTVGGGTTDGTTTGSGSSHHHSNSSSSSSNNSSATFEKNIVVDGKNEWKQNLDGTWYFINSNKEKVVGWLKDTTGLWYYLNKDGIMQTGWLKDTDGLWYYLNENGAMKIGWLKDFNGLWYYLNDNGSMKTGWLKDINGKWYYLNASGDMAINITIDGYELDDTGACIY